jgi:hypothetical protein
VLPFRQRARLHLGADSRISMSGCSPSFQAEVVCILSARAFCASGDATRLVVARRIPPGSASRKPRCGQWTSRVSLQIVRRCDNSGGTLRSRVWAARVGRQGTGRSNRQVVPCVQLSSPLLRRCEEPGRRAGVRSYWIHGWCGHAPWLYPPRSPHGNLTLGRCALRAVAGCRSRALIPSASPRHLYRRCGRRREAILAGGRRRGGWWEETRGGTNIWLFGQYFGTLGSLIGGRILDTPPPVGSVSNLPGVMDLI